jgi:hypothetical protein
MIERKSAIHVYSEINEWIDFCIVVEDEDCDRAEEIVNKAYDDWFADDFTSDETLADYIGNCLVASGIIYEIFSKEEEHA